MVYVGTKSEIFQSVYYDPIIRKLYFLLEINEAYSLKDIEYDQFFELIRSDDVDTYFEENFKGKKFEEENPEYLSKD